MKKVLILAIFSVLTFGYVYAGPPRSANHWSPAPAVVHMDTPHTYTNHGADFRNENYRMRNKMKFRDNARCRHQGRHRAAMMHTKWHR